MLKRNKTIVKILTIAMSTSLINTGVALGATEEGAGTVTQDISQESNSNNQNTDNLNVTTQAAVTINNTEQEPQVNSNEEVPIKSTLMKSGATSENTWTDDKKCTINEIIFKDTSVGTNNTVSVSGYTASVSSDIKLPDSISVNGTTYMVTSIGSAAFNKCSGLKSITIPEGLTSIGDSAFDSCELLTEITIPKGVESIGYGTFGGCSKLGKITLPEGLTSIGQFAFENCTELASITLPEGLTSIGKTAFQKCENLESIVIPKGVKNIEQNTFNGCIKLKNVTLQKGLESIGYCAFYKCSNLGSIIVPEGVKNIGEFAFDGCSALSNVTIQDGLEDINNVAFCGCNELTNITIPKTVKSIGNNAFDGCSKLSEVKMQGGVKSIGQYAFSGCSDLNNITIPETVTNIGNYAFMSCSKLNNIIIPNKVTSIGYCTFYLCSGLTNVTIPESVTSIGDYAFDGCSSLKIIAMPKVTSIGQFAFHGCSGVTELWSDNDSLKSNFSGATFIKSNLSSKTCEKGDVVQVSASIDGSNSTYEWYSNTINSTNGATSVSKDSKYSIPTTERGTKYYYCIVNDGSKIYTSPIAKITVQCQGSTKNTIDEAKSIIENNLKTVVVNNDETKESLISKLRAGLDDNIEVSFKDDSFKMEQATVGKEGSISGTLIIKDTLRGNTADDTLVNIKIDKLLVSKQTSEQGKSIIENNLKTVVVNNDETKESLISKLRAGLDDNIEVSFKDDSFNMVNATVGKEGSISGTLIIKDTLRGNTAYDTLVNIKIDKLLVSKQTSEQGKSIVENNLKTVVVNNDETKESLISKLRAGLDDNIEVSFKDDSFNMEQATVGKEGSIGGTLLITDTLRGTNESIEVIRVISKLQSNSNSSGGGSSSSSSSSTDSNKVSDTVTANNDEASIINAINSKDAKTIVINVDNSNSTNATNAGTTANTLLINENILKDLKANSDKTLVIKSKTATNGTSTIEIKSSVDGQIQFTENKVPVTGFRTVGNAEYYLNANGIMQTGWVQLPGNTYYHLNQTTGVKERGWVKDNTTWYYLDKTSGIMKSGWIKDNDKWYYLNNNGAMKTNWVNDNDTWYYLNADGTMKTGWLKDSDGRWYYLGSDGAMASNTTVDGYYVNGSGTLSN